MSGRNKRAAVAFFAQLRRDIWRAEEEAEERQSAEHWRFSGPDGFANSLMCAIGKAAVEVRVYEDWKGSHQVLNVTMRYRGNGVTHTVLTSEAVYRRKYVMRPLVQAGQALLMMPCAHEKRPIRQDAETPPVDWVNMEVQEMLAGSVRAVLVCPDCRGEMNR